MRRIVRLVLPPSVRKGLRDRQAKVVNASTTPDAIALDWKSGRKSKPVTTALAVLKKMAGPRQRCMYCEDSHGADIDHFWPKSAYPERMYSWDNLLLNCTECGRFKGERFPARNGVPLMINPTEENPWEHLDFHPATGNLNAKYLKSHDAFSVRGETTVEILQLDRREGLAEAYKKAHRRMVKLLEDIVLQEDPDVHACLAQLRETDDHGLMGWYFTGTGSNEKYMANLREAHPHLWLRGVEICS
jgi:uncharacterized protein (TIGR02646 family)